MNVNENLLQLALRESQDTNMFKLSFNSNIIWKILQRSSMMTVTCYCSGKDTLESYTKQVHRKDTMESYTKQVYTGKNEIEIFEENVITKQIKFKIEIKLTSIIKFSHFIFSFILSSMGKIWERKNFTDISYLTHAWSESLSK